MHIAADLLSHPTGRERVKDPTEGLHITESLKLCGRKHMDTCTSHKGCMHDNLHKKCNCYQKKKEILLAEKCPKY